jgi:hypothetical protein
MATQQTACMAATTTLPSFFSLRSTCDANIFGSAVAGSNQHVKVNSKAQDKHMNDCNSDDEELAESQDFYKYQREDAENRLKRTLFDKVVKKYRFTCSAPII